MSINTYLQQMVDCDASDLYLSVGAKPSVKIHGQMQPFDEAPLSADQIKTLAHEIMNEQQAKDFETQLECNLALNPDKIGRFRVNIFKQRNAYSLVIRAIKTVIPSQDSLGLPPILTDLIMRKRGLILFVGATGSGKSTSLASLVNHRNQHAHDHIITIEDPIEFIHEHKQSVVNQREVGLDTNSYENALKNTLRQAPDVILIGEIRSLETMEHAIAFAETGHLCLSTLHANNANQAIERIINFFPIERHNQIYLDLSLNLLAIVSQRLVKTTDGQRTAAIEILIGSPLVRELIKRQDITGLKEQMERSENLGMQTFDQALYKLVEAGTISEEEALHHADSTNNLRLALSLAKGKAGDGSSLQLEDDENDGF